MAHRWPLQRPCSGMQCAPCIWLQQAHTPVSPSSLHVASLSPDKQGSWRERHCSQRVHMLIMPVALVYRGAHTCSQTGRPHRLPASSGAVSSLICRAQVRVVASLPCYTGENVDQQRGSGVFRRSILGLQLLNAAGYGQPGSPLQLDLVYNPNGTFLAPPQAQLQVGSPDMTASAAWLGRLRIFTCDVGLLVRRVGGSVYRPACHSQTRLAGCSCVSRDADLWLNGRRKPLFLRGGTASNTSSKVLCRHSFQSAVWSHCCVFCSLDSAWPAVPVAPP